MKKIDQKNQEIFNITREKDAMGREDKLYMESLEFSKPESEASKPNSRVSRIKIEGIIPVKER
tara:strand:- start:15 stop:203 length:189 start_codon:yes stop_codon:yes gene_type:complete